MSKIISAFAFATFLSLPAFAAVSSVTPNERAANEEITAPRIIVEDTKAQEPRVHVAPCHGGCYDLDELWGS